MAVYFAPLVFGLRCRPAAGAAHRPRATAPGGGARRPWAPSASATRLLRRLAGAGALAALLAGCSTDPGATLFDPPPRQPAGDAPVAAVDADGFPNVLATPGVAPARYRPPGEVQREEASLAARGSRLDREAAATAAAPSSAADLERRAATHVEEANAVIEASGRRTPPE